MAKTPAYPITLLVALVCLLAFSHAKMCRDELGQLKTACLKRSGMTEIDSNIRECPSCGVNNTGECVNPHTCCGDFGCHMGTVDARVCQGDQKTEKIATPCHLRGRACGDDGNSTCAAPGICCNYDYCVFSVECEAPKPQQPDGPFMTKIKANVGRGNV